MNEGNPESRGFCCCCLLGLPEACGADESNIDCGRQSARPIQMTYECDPCRDDNTNYMIFVDPGCLGEACPPSVTVVKPLLRHNTVTWVGRLPPGSHTIEPVVHNPRGRVIITFSRGAEENSGGIRPDSMKIESSGASGDRHRFSRCAWRYSQPILTTPCYTFEYIGSSGFRLLRSGLTIAAIYISCFSFAALSFIPS